MRWSLLPVLAFAACGDRPPAPANRPAATAVQATHDFGVIPHGEQRTHEFPLDLTGFGPDWVPLRVHLDCSCGHADLRLRDANGKERFVDGSGRANGLPAPGESLFVHLEIDTSHKEAVDQQRVESRGYAVLQQLGDATGQGRVQWPFAVFFGIEAPVDLRPLAAFEFGNVPISAPVSKWTTLRGDALHADAAFGPATCDDPAIGVDLAKDGDHWLLRATASGTEPGHHRATITVANTIPGYRLQLPVAWKIVPDLVASPIAKVSVMAHLDREQSAAEAVGQFVNVVDHDRKRSPEFAVLRCVDDAGNDLSSHFDITFEPTQEPRQQRLHVRYKGGLTQGVRGSIVLTKNAEQGPLLPIELVVLAAKQT